MGEPGGPIDSHVNAVPRQILFTEKRDFLLDAAGTHVNANFLGGKVVAVLIGPHWLPVPLEQAVSVIVDPCKELQKAKKEIAFVYVCADRDPNLIETLRRYGQTSQLDERPDSECFNDVLKKLPEGWLAVPLDDSEVREKLCSLYRTGIFSLTFVGADGRTHTKDGLRVLEKWGAEAYPFDDDRINSLEEAVKQRLANQNLKDLLVHDERDYVIASQDSRQVKVQDLQGKTVGLYFSAHWCPPCQKFTPVLASIYEQLKKSKKDFEIVFISSDEDQASFDKYFKEMPWLAVPYSDLVTKKLLNNWFEVEGIPTLVILDQQGKTLQTEGMEIIYKYGIEAYPFTAERLRELKQEEEAKRASQTLEKLLVTDERDYVITNLDTQVKVSSLVGKTVGLYFSGHWCPPCRRFTPKLKSVYDELKHEHGKFEVVFVSSDKDESSFKDYHNSMPWLALPYCDKATRTLSQYFDVQGIPQLVIIGPDGKTVETDGRALTSLHGAKAFPFTSDPFVSVHYGNQKKRTKVIYKTLHPQWNQTLEFADDGKVLELHVKDHNTVFPTSSIGHCNVEYQSLPHNQTVEQWIPLQGVRKGEIHVQITRRFHQAIQSPCAIDKKASSVQLSKMSTKICAIVREASSLAEEGDLEQLCENIGMVECVASEQDTHISQLLREKEMLLAKINELEKATEGIKLIP